MANQCTGDQMRGREMQSDGIHNQSRQDLMNDIWLTGRDTVIAFQDRWTMGSMNLPRVKGSGAEGVTVLRWTVKSFRSAL